MLKKIIAATAVAGALGIIAAPAMAETACVDFFIDVNGTAQTIHQCV